MENRNEQNNPRNEEPGKGLNPTADNHDRNSVSGEQGKRQEEERESLISKQNADEGRLGPETIELEEGEDPGEVAKQTGNTAEEQHKPLK